jgi:hypothetical protein
MQTFSKTLEVTHKKNQDIAHADFSLICEEPIHFPSLYRNIIVKIDFTTFP